MRQGWVGRGLAWHGGLGWPGLVRPGQVRPGEARQVRQGKMWRVAAGQAKDSLKISYLVVDNVNNGALCPLLKRSRNG